MAFYNAKNMDLKWEGVCKAFPMDSDVFSISEVRSEDLSSVITTLKEFNIGQIVVNLSLDFVWDKLRKDIVPKFWDHFTTFAEAERARQQPVEQCIEVLNKAVEELHDNIIGILPLFKRCDEVIQRCDVPFESESGGEGGLLSLLKLHLRATLHSQMPFCFPVLVHRVYRAAFKSYCHIKGYIQDDDVDISTDSGSFCNGCSSDECRCEKTISAFTKINSHLRELELLERLCGSIIAEMLFSAIHSHVDAICRDSYDLPHIYPLEKWLKGIVVSWLRLCYCGSDDDQENVDPSVQKMISANLEQTYLLVVYHKYTTTRISQLFNIVIEFPESQPALEDIRECLEKTDLRSNLVESLRSSIQTRLLHPGVNTVDIIHAYISAVKALRVLDPRGILLELISEPIRQYLRGRSDFVRYIVTNLTDDTSSELSEEMMVAAPLVLDDSYSEVEDVSNWETWTPDPSHAQNSIKSKSQRTADIISMLVNIYGSKDVFITEYRTILADRILSQFSYDTEREIRYLEHLKVRFGETLPLLHKCEVMVKDVADSKRINSSIQSDQNPHQPKHQFPVSAMILSGQFWPSFKEESLQLPQEVLQELSIYTKAFQDLKGNRTLNWKNHLGQVQLEVELSNKVLNLNVSPIQATVLLHFERRAKWTLADLSRATLVPKASLRKKLSFWQAQGVIKETDTDVYSLVEGEEPCDVTSTATPPLDAPPPLPEEALFNSSAADDESESVMASAQDQRQEDLQVLWSYIVGMLTNLDALPLERIHAMLRMFVQDSVECSLEELKAFFDTKCRQHQLVLNNGVYRLPK